MNTIRIKLNPALEEESHKLANALSVELTEACFEADSDFVLEPTEQGILLHTCYEEGFKPFSLNFDDAPVYQGPDPLVRAMGKQTHTVVDATAGWANDAIHLCQYGFQVTALEKNKLVWLMLIEALSRTTNLEIKNNLEILNKDAIEYLSNASVTPDVVYLDPMYPARRKKSAVAQKKLVILQRLIELDENTEEMIQVARTHATKRVVIKRPHSAQSIEEGKVGETRGKLVRYDIYSPLH